MEFSCKFKEELFSLKERILKSIKVFQNGGLILVGDDGIRENEADLVFHASAASSELVNFAITHAKGLLCVSLSNQIANKLGFNSAPQYPNGIPHTNFTLPVDARHGITSGISAKDRAHTISLMAQEQSTPFDFLSPGHVFPVRAMDGGLLARTGHTEALLELCQLSNLPSAAAMCEILGENGNAMTTASLCPNSNFKSIFSDIPFVSTVDILWYKILFYKNTMSTFKFSNQFLLHNNHRKPIETFIFEPNLEQSITFSIIINIYSKTFEPENIKFTMTNSISAYDNTVSTNSCCAEISFYSPENFLEEIPNSIHSYCNMSSKEGLKGTNPSIKRIVSLLRSLQFIQNYYQLTPQQWNFQFHKINFILEEDKKFIELLFNNNI